MKKLIGIFVIACMLMSLCSGFVYADEVKPQTEENVAESETVEISEEAADLETEETVSEEVEEIAEAEPVPGNRMVYVNISMIPRMVVKDSAAVIELYDQKGAKIGEREEWVGGITERLELKFEVPLIKAGDKFTLRLKSGLAYLKYYDKVYGEGEDITLEAYGYKVAEGNEGVVATFELDACPLYEHAIVVYVENNQLQLYPRARLIDGTAMVPVRAVAEAMGIKVRYDEVYNSVVCSVGDQEAIFNLGTSYATIFGEDTYLPRECEMIDDTAYVPARVLAETFGAEVEALDFGDHIDVCIGQSQMVYEYMQSFPVNKWNLSSRTRYLVWVDKSDYRVRVYTGSKNKWVEAKSFSCAIGAPGSPTITGSYEYQYRMEAWHYDGYYVGPCLVFYGNYALHSTLIGYNGRPYDDRTGVMISHGCIRLHKADIDWLDRNLPVGSRIYITE